MCVYDFNDIDTSFDINFLEKFFNDALIHKEFDVPIDVKLPCNQIIHVVFNEIHINNHPDIYKMWFAVRALLISGFKEITIYDILQQMDECPKFFKMCLSINNNEIDKMYEVVNEANNLLTYLQDLRGMMPFEPCEIDFLFNNNNCTKDYVYYDDYSSDGEHYLNSCNYKYRNKNVRKLYRYIHDYVDSRHRCNNMF
mgnify:CR=1 FL=1